MLRLSRRVLNRPLIEKYEERCAASDSVLSRRPYKLLLEKLDEYKAMQGKYAVKQDDMERARRAAAVCGLQMTERKAAEKASKAPPS